MGNVDSMKAARSAGYDLARLHGYNEALAANPYTDDRCRLAYNRGAFQAFQEA